MLAATLSVGRAATFSAGRYSHKSVGAGRRPARVTHNSKTNYSAFGVLGVKSRVLAWTWQHGSFIFPRTGRSATTAQTGTLILPFKIASLCSMLKSVGDLTLCEKINDSNWKRTV